MNREIKFRGQRLDKSELVYGDLIHGVGSKRGKVFILPAVENLAQIRNCDPLDGVTVIPETIGQFTGLQDKNGKDIYEMDIVGNDNGVKYTVEWVEQICGFYLCGIGTQRGREFISCAASKAADEPIKLFKIEIIGNIYESPELLNQSKQQTL